MADEFLDALLALHGEDEDDGKMSLNEEDIIENDEIVSKDAEASFDNLESRQQESEKEKETKNELENFFTHEINHSNGVRNQENSIDDIPTSDFSRKIAETHEKFLSYSKTLKVKVAKIPNENKVNELELKLKSGSNHSQTFESNQKKRERENLTVQNSQKESDSFITIEDGNDNDVNSNNNRRIVYTSDDDDIRPKRKANMSAFESTISDFPFIESFDSKKSYDNDDTIKKNNEKLNDKNTDKNKINNINELNKNKTNQMKSNENLEEYSGLRIKDRKISSTELRKKMEGISFLPLPAVDSFISNVKKNKVELGTIGILCNKSPTKLSSAGKKYITFTLCNFTAMKLRVILFGNALEAFWKESVGAVCAVFKPGILPNRDNSGSALSIFDVNQFSILGKSTDFGLCNGENKNNGSCNAVIDRREGNYCPKHRHNAFKMLKSKRMELGGGTMSLAILREKQTGKMQNIFGDEQYLNKKEKPRKKVTLEKMKNILEKPENVTSKSCSQGLRFLNKISGIKDVSVKEKSNEENKESNTKNLKTERPCIPEKSNKPLSNFDELFSLTLEKVNDEEIEAINYSNI